MRIYGQIYGKTARTYTAFQARGAAADKHSARQCFGGKDLDFIDIVGAVGSLASSRISVHDVRKVAPDAEKELSAATAGDNRGTKFLVFNLDKGRQAVWQNYNA